MESSWQFGSFESSEEDKSKDEKGGSKPRRDPPRILNMSHMHEGQIDLRSSRPEVKPLPKPLFEGLLQDKQEHSDASSTPDKVPESEAQHINLEAAPSDLPRITEAGRFAETTPDHIKTETAKDDEKETGEDDDEGSADASASGQRKPAIAWQRSAPLPPVEAAPATPGHPEEFDEVMQQLGSEYAEAASGNPSESPVSGEIPAGFRAGEEEQPLLSHDDEPVAPAAATGGTPPSPPAGPGEFSSAASPEEPDPQPQRTTSYAYSPPPPPPPAWATGGNTGPGNGANVAINTAPAPAFEQQPATPNQAEYKRGLRRGLVAGFITGYAVKAYLAHRKQKRVEKATQEQFATANERFTNLQFQHNQLQQKTTSQTEQLQRAQREQQERFDRFKANQPAPERFETPSASPAIAPLPRIEAVPRAQLPKAEAMPPLQEATAEQEQWVDELGNEIALQPGQRLERRGWYSVVVDEHGREVPGAIHYGEAFQREQKREQVSDAAFAGSDANASSKTTAPSNNAAPAAGGVFTALPGVGISSVPASTPPPVFSEPMISSGQADPAHSLPAGQPTTVDPQHRLKEPRNQVVATITSPWLWVAVAVLLIAYFTAALV
jgi:hypothetical protein